MLFKLDAITILPIPCVKHVLRIVFICMWQLSNSQTFMYIRIFKETCLKWPFLGFSAKYLWVQLISQVLLTEVLRNLYDRNQRFLDLIFSYKYQNPALCKHNDRILWPASWPSGAQDMVEEAKTTQSAMCRTWKWLINSEYVNHNSIV